MRQHRFDPFSLVFGAVFLSVGGAFLFGSTLGDARRSVLPTVAILVGGALVAWAVVAVVRERRASDPARPESNDPRG